MHFRSCISCCLSSFDKNWLVLSLYRISRGKQNYNNIKSLRARSKVTVGRAGAARKTFPVLVVTPRYIPSNPENNVAWLEDSPLIPCQIRNLPARHVDRWKFRANLSFWNFSLSENWHLNFETEIVDVWNTMIRANNSFESIITRRKWRNIDRIIRRKSVIGNNVRDVFEPNGEIKKEEDF